MGWDDSNNSQLITQAAHKFLSAVWITGTSACGRDVAKRKKKEIGRPGETGGEPTSSIHQVFCPVYVCAGDCIIITQL